MKRALLERIFAKALGELDPGERVREALVAAPRPPARVVAIGKAAPAMAGGALRAWGTAVERCLVVAPDDTALCGLERAAARAGLGRRMVVMRAGHPLPDARSVRAARACLELVASARPESSLLVLVSGGASALVCAPARGITLAQKRAVTRVMLASGASVQEINVVRKHLSRIKGGGLARAATARDVRTLVASDVLGGAPSDVGSGPSVADGTTVAEARRLLRRYAPAFGDVALVPTWPGGPAKTAGAPAAATATPRASSRVRTVVAPEDLARVMRALLRERGLQVRVLAPSQAAAGELAAEYVALARASSGQARAFVRVAEPSVTVRPRAGRGGRSTHLAALVGRALHGGGQAGHAGALGGVTFAAFASDGVDGASGTGGAVVDGAFASRVAEQLGRSALDRAITRFDTGPLHRAMGTALPRHPTGHNLADLHVLVVV